MPTAVVDVHTHIYPRRYIDRLAARDELPRVERRGDQELFVIFPGETGRVLDETYWSLDEKLAYMDRSGITRSVVSLGNPWLEPFGAEGSEIAREMNSELSSFEGRTGGRVVGMGCLPNGNVSDVVEVIEEVAATDGLYGVVSGTKLCGAAFDEEQLEPIWEVLESTNVPLLVHPHAGLGLGELDGFGHALPLALGFPFETSVALARLVMGGVLDRFPGLVVIGSHGGGTIPFLAARLDGCWSPDEVARARRSTPPSEGLSRLYFDALVYHPRGLRAVSELAGTARMLFGTDHPFAIADPAVNIGSIEATFDRAVAADVLAQNAERVFGLPPLATGGNVA